MRRRDLMRHATIGFFGLIFIALMVYSPVLFAWWSREEESIDSTFERYAFGAERRVWVKSNWFMNRLPLFYNRILVFHAGLNGWAAYYDLETDVPPSECFFPDGPEFKTAKERRRKLYQEGVVPNP